MTGFASYFVIHRAARGRRLSMFGAWVALLVGATEVRAQETPERLIWRGMIGDVAFDVRAVPGTVRLGAASDSVAVTVQLRVSDVRRFLDSLAVRTRGRRLRDTSWTLRVEEPGVGAGVMSVAPLPRTSGTARRYRLFASDEVATGVRQDMSTAELQLLSRQLGRAAQPPKTVKPAPTRRRAPSVRRPTSAKPPSTG